MKRNKIGMDERIIVALDVENGERARRLVRELEGETRFFKVGLQLFLAEGFPMVDWIAGRGHRIMLDLKFYDIPKTVELACRQLNRRNITFATVHGNNNILDAAVLGAKDYSVLAVTVLTSLGNEELKEVRSPLSMGRLVEMRAAQAKKAGCRGVVCSPLEARAVRKLVGNRMFIVTPGIRPSGLLAGLSDDQKRTETPYAAIKAGADFLVIGRPITTSKNPAESARKIKEEIQKALL